MKNRYLTILTLFVALFAAPVVLHADDDDSDSFGVRLSGEADYKIMKGMHVNVSEELRLSQRSVVRSSSRRLRVQVRMQR